VSRTVRRHVLRVRHIGSVDLKRSRVSLDIACTGPTSTSGKTAPPEATVAGGSSGGTLLFNGTFDKGLANYAEQNGKCFSALNSQEERFSITSLCDPGQDGRFRSDLNTRNLYRAGVPVCTSIPIRFPTGMLGVPDSTWLGFAETEDPHNPNQNDLAGWGMGLNSYYTGNTVASPNQYQIEFADYNGAAPAWTSSGNVDTAWHTLSICTNNANDSSGVVYGIWLDGARQTFNHGPQAGSQTLSGFPIIQNDPANKTNWPLIINDYTGGTPVSNTIVHGPPLVASMGTDGLPPEQSGGWNSP